MYNGNLNLGLLEHGKGVGTVVNDGLNPCSWFCTSPCIGMASCLTCGLATAGTVLAYDNNRILRQTENDKIMHNIAQGKNVVFRNKKDKDDFEKDVRIIVSALREGGIKSQKYAGLLNKLYGQEEDGLKVVEGNENAGDMEDKILKAKRKESMKEFILSDLKGYYRKKGNVVDDVEVSDMYIDKSIPWFNDVWRNAKWFGDARSRGKFSMLVGGESGYYIADVADFVELREKSNQKDGDGIAESFNISESESGISSANKVGNGKSKSKTRKRRPGSRTQNNEIFIKRRRYSNEDENSVENDNVSYKNYKNLSIAREERISIENFPDKDKIFPDKDKILIAIKDLDTKITNVHKDVDVLKGSGDEILNKINEKADSITGITSSISTKISTIDKNISTNIGKVNGAIKETGEKILNKIDAKGDSITSSISTKISTIDQNISTNIGKVNDAIKETGEEILNKIDAKGDSITSSISACEQSLSKKVDGLLKLLGTVDSDEDGNSIGSEYGKGAGGLSNNQSRTIFGKLSRIERSMMQMSNNVTGGNISKEYLKNQIDSVKEKLETLKKIKESGNNTDLSQSFKDSLATQLNEIKEKLAKSSQDVSEIKTDVSQIKNTALETHKVVKETNKVVTDNTESWKCKGHVNNIQKGETGGGLTFGKFSDKNNHSVRNIIEGSKLNNKRKKLGNGEVCGSGIHYYYGNGKVGEHLAKATDKKGSCDVKNFNFDKKGSRSIYSYNNKGDIFEADRKNNIFYSNHNLNNASKKNDNTCAYRRAAGYYNPYSATELWRLNNTGSHSEIGRETVCGLKQAYKNQNLEK